MNPKTLSSGEQVPLFPTQQGRYPVTAKFIGVMHREMTTVKMFMISILWTDSTEVIIYRSFDDFKKFHAHLKRKFPYENMIRRADGNLIIRTRQLPKFRGGALLTSLQKKGSPEKSIHRLKFLETYTNELLRCDPTITQSPDISLFFLPQDHDLQPDFNKNSTMIVPPDSLAPDGVHETVVGNVTSPFMTQTYKCVANLDIKDTNNRDLRVAEDECVDVLIKDQSGWWLIESESKQLAWFPAPYLEVVCDSLDEEEEELDEIGPDGMGSLYCAARTFSSKKQDEISIPIGTVVECLKKSDDGWWLVRYAGNTGYVPSMYLQPYTNPAAGLETLVNKRTYSSSYNLAAQAAGLTPAGIGITRQPTLHEEDDTDDSQPSSQSSSTPASQSGFQSNLQPTSRPTMRRISQPAALPSEQPSAPAQVPGNNGPFQTPKIMEGVDDDTQQTTKPVSDLGGLDTDSLRGKSSDSSTCSSSPLGGSECSSPDVDFSSLMALNPDADITLNPALSSMPSSSLPNPSVPPRPQSDEMLNRGSTLTRKGALAAKARRTSIVVMQSDD